MVRRWRGWLMRVGAMFSRTRGDAELSAELESHLQLHFEDNLRSGMTPAAARRDALMKLGGIEQTRESYRDQRAFRLIDELRQDLGYGLRMMRASPGFSAIAIFTLALGIGANSAIFGLVDTAFLRALPYREPERLVHVWTIETDHDVHTPTPAQYQAVRDNSRSFEEVAAAGWADYFYTPDGSISQDLPGSLVTPNWLTTLGIRPLLGRDFREDEQIAGHDGVVILSYDCWHTRFHAEPSAVGRQIVLNHRPVTIIGVLPQSLGPYNDVQEIFAPLVLGSYARQGNVRAGKMRVQIIARLRPGVTLGEARSEADVIAAQFKNPHAEADRSERFVVEDFGEMFGNPGPTVQNAERGLWITALASGVVLLIACANVASLLLARGLKRHREIAVRSALGCSRRRMIRQLLTETSLLFLCGGVVAVVITRWGQEIVTQRASEMLPGVYLSVDVRVFTVSLAVSFLSALAFGMIPAWQATRVSLNEKLKESAPSAGNGLHPRRLRNCLVAGQVALGMVLLVGFGLLLRSLLKVESSNLGYDPHNVMTATIRLPFTRYTAPSDRARLMGEAVERLREVPGVVSVGVASSLPMEGAESDQFRIEGSSLMAKPIQDRVYFVSVSPDYFSTLKSPMAAGRAFREADDQASSPVAIINQTFAKQYFPGVNPIGCRLAFVNTPGAWREIVGVVSDFRQRNPEEDLRPLAYFPVAQTLPGRWSMAIRVRAAGDLGIVSAHISSWLQPVDPDLSWELGSMLAQIHDSESLTLRRPLITLFASFGGLAMILVVVGVFGVTSYSVAERTREIGIRTALGASHAEVAGLIRTEALGIALLGLALGTVGALAVARVFPVQGIGWSGSGIFLYGVSRTDPLTYLAAALLLVSTVLTASWLPARRAMQIDPLVALRYE